LGYWDQDRAEAGSLVLWLSSKGQTDRSHLTLAWCCSCGCG